MTSIARLAFVIFCFVGLSATAEAQNNVQQHHLYVVASNMPGVGAGTVLPNCVIGDNWIPNPTGGFEDAAYIPSLPNSWYANNAIHEGFMMAVDVDYFLRIVVIGYGPFVLVCKF